MKLPGNMTTNQYGVCVVSALPKIPMLSCEFDTSRVLIGTDASP